MLLKSLKLKNIRSYSEQAIEFPNGSSLLLGDIGSGKTTILLAIEFALFGLIKGDVSGSTLLRHGSKEGAVELSFKLEGKDITIKRALKRKKDSIAQDSGYIIMEDKIAELTPIELKSKVLELFGYPQELLNKNTSLIYRYTVYTPQEEMKSILFESKEERLDTLRKVFNIDKYKLIRENALNYSRELRNQKKILESKTTDLEFKKMSLEDKNTEKLSMEVSLKRFIEEADSCKESFDAQTEKLSLHEKGISELNSLRTEQAVLLSDIKNTKLMYDKNVKELSMIDFRIRDYSAKLQELGDMQLDEESFKLQLKDYEDKLSKIKTAKEVVKQGIENKNADLKRITIEDMQSLRMRNMRLTKELEAKSGLEKELESLEHDHDTILLELNSLNISKIRSQKLIDQLKDLSTCPTCLQKVDFSHKINITDKETLNIASSERHFKELAEKHSATESKIKLQKRDLEELRKKEIELREVKIRLEEVSQKEEERQRLLKELEELQSKQSKLDSLDVNKLIDLISKNRKILNSFEVRKHVQQSLQEKQLQQKDISEIVLKLDSDIKSLSDKDAALSVKIKSFNDVEKEYISMKEELRRLAQELKDREIKLSSAKKELEIIKRDVKVLEEDIKLKMQINEKVRRIEELHFWLNEHFIKLTSLIEKYIMAKIHQEFNSLFSKWFEILMDDESLEVSIDEEFAPKIRQNDYDTYVENLSGGEKTAIALAYRLALNKVINDFIHNIKTKDIIILDEPTDGFSEEQLDKMREVFEELHMPQLIIVSHEAKMESYVQNIIRITKNNHISKVM